MNAGENVGGGKKGKMYFMYRPYWLGTNWGSLTISREEGRTPKNPSAFTSGYLNKKLKTNNCSFTSKHKRVIFVFSTQFVQC